jgi:hypothetical protein
MGKEVTTKKSTDLGAATALLPKIPEFNAPAVAQELKQFSDQATRVFEGAQRAVISDLASATVATDFLKSINQRIKDIEAARKKTTGKFDSLVKSMNTLFNKGPKARLELAAEIMQAKLTVFARAEREKAEAQAQRERERIAAEAAAAATVAVEEGDTEGALEILEDAASAEVAAGRTEVRGHTAVLASTKRKVGKVTNLRAFMSWLAETKTPMAMAAIAGVSFGQRELKQHAAAVIATREAEGDTSIGVPGFEAEYEETFGAR